MDFIKKIKTYGLKKVFQYIIPETKRVLRRLLYGSYSHLGEDLFLSTLFPKEYKGFYVDVGANDPISKSNTYLFYKRGWKGINIEPDIVCYQKIKKVRTRDINLNIGIGEMDGVLDYYSMFPSSLNTFLKENSDRSISEGYKLIEVKKVEVKRLEEVLEKYLDVNTKIDFMSVDTEGYDLSVLKSMNIERFKPRFICFECIDKNVSHDIERLLTENNYSKIYSNGSNGIFKLAD